MERYDSAAHEARHRRTREAEDPSPPPPPATQDDPGREPAPEDQVTPYDHLWFDRRPLS